MLVAQAQSLGARATARQNQGFDAGSDDHRLRAATDPAKRPDHFAAGRSEKAIRLGVQFEKSLSK